MKPALEKIPLLTPESYVKKTGRTEPYWPFLPNECVIAAPICCLYRIAQFGIFRPGQPQRAFT